jgi:hypothetical protein
MTIEIAEIPAFLPNRYNIQADIREIPTAPNAVYTAERWATVDDPNERAVLVQTSYSPLYEIRITTEIWPREIMFANMVRISYTAIDSPDLVGPNTVTFRALEAEYDADNKVATLRGRTTEMIVNNYFSQDWLGLLTRDGLPTTAPFNTLDNVIREPYTVDVGAKWLTPLRPKWRSVVGLAENSQTGALVDYPAVVESFAMLRFAFYLNGNDTAELLRAARRGGGETINIPNSVPVPTFAPQYPTRIETEGEPVEGAIDLYLTILQIPYSRELAVQSLT